MAEVQDAAESIPGQVDGPGFVKVEGQGFLTFSLWFLGLRHVGQLIFPNHRRDICLTANKPVGGPNVVFNSF